MLYAIINSDSGFALLINIVLLSYENWSVLHVQVQQIIPATILTAMADAVRLPAFNSPKMFFIEIGLWCVSYIVWGNITGISKVLIKKYLAVAFYSWNLEKIFILFPESIFIINDRDDWWIFRIILVFLPVWTGVDISSSACNFLDGVTVLPFFRKHCALPIRAEM